MLEMNSPCPNTVGSRRASQYMKNLIFVPHMTYPSEQWQQEAAFQFAFQSRLYKSIHLCEMNLLRDELRSSIK